MLNSEQEYHSARFSKSGVKSPHSNARFAR
jgi:hypothetical protein